MCMWNLKNEKKNKNHKLTDSENRLVGARSESWRWAKWVKGIKGHTLPVVK